MWRWILEYRRDASMRLGLAKRRITADTALRLARYFGTSPQFWLGLQMDYDLDVTEEAIAKRLAQEVRPYAVS